MLHNSHRSIFPPFPSSWDTRKYSSHELESCYTQLGQLVKMLMFNERVWYFWFVSLQNMSFPLRTCINCAKPPGIPTMCSPVLDLAPYTFVRLTDPCFDSLIRSFCSASSSWGGSKSKYIMVRLFNPSLANIASHRLPSQKSITIFLTFDFLLCMYRRIS